MIDKYLYFTFNGVESSKFNCFIENDGEDLLYPAFPSFNDDISSPLFQNRSFYLGTSKENRVFNFTCACDSINYNEFKLMQRWLDVDTIGDLYLSFCRNYHWRVKVASFSNVKILPILNNESRIHCEFDLSFTTIEDFAAISNRQYELDLVKLRNNSIDNTSIIDYDFRLPLVDYNPITPESSLFQYRDRIRFFNHQSYEFYPKIILNRTKNFEIGLLNNNKYYDVDKKEWPRIKQWYKYALNKDEVKNYDLTINSEVGYVINNNTNKLIEESFIDELQYNRNNFINNGNFSIENDNLIQNNLELISVSQGIVDGTESKNALILEFNGSISQLTNYDHGRINDQGHLLENIKSKAIFIQQPGFDDYLLYNEGEYNTKKYYVNEHYIFYSYCFNVENGYLKIGLTNIGNNWEDESLINAKEYLTSLIGTELIVSICDYTELDINSFITENNNNIYSNNNIIFNLRTIF